jgi:hypothetical protein
VPQQPAAKWQSEEEGRHSGKGIYQMTAAVIPEFHAIEKHLLKGVSRESFSLDRGDP